MFSYISSYFTSLWDNVFGTLFTFLSSSSSFNQKQNGRLLVLGLDNAGKTTLLQAIRNQSQQSHTNNTNINNSTNRFNYPPTDRPEYIKNIVTIQNRISFHAYDLGGHEAVRHLWCDYYHTTNTNTNNSNDMNDDTNNDNNNNNTNNLAILFCIDIADMERLEEASYELDALIHDLIGSDGDGGGGRDTNTTNTTAGTGGSSGGIPIAILLTKCDTMHDEQNNTNTTHNTKTKEELLSNIPKIQETLDYKQLQQQYKHYGNGSIELFTISVYEQYGYMDALVWITKQLTVSSKR